VLLGELLGKPLLLHLLDRLAECADLAGHVATSDAAIADVLRGRGIDALLEPRARDAADSDAAARHAVSRCLARGLFPPDAPLLILDCRNPFLSGATLAACRRLLEEEPEAVLASFSTADDHPPQQFQPFSIEQVETLVFLDPSPEAAALSAGLGLGGRGRLSFPVFFDWRGQDVGAESPGLYALETGPGRRLVCPRPVDAAAPGPPEQGLLYLWDSPWSARRVVPLELIREEGAAHPAHARQSGLPLRMLRRGGGLVLRQREPDGAAARLLRLWPLCGTMPGTALDMHLPAQAEADRDIPLPAGTPGLVAALLATPATGSSTIWSGSWPRTSGPWTPGPCCRSTRRPGSPC